MALTEPGPFPQPLSTHMLWESLMGNFGGENRYCCSPEHHTQNRRSRKKESFSCFPGIPPPDQPPSQVPASAQIGGWGWVGGRGGGKDWLFSH